MWLQSQDSRKSREVEFCPPCAVGLCVREGRGRPTLERKTGKVKIVEEVRNLHTDLHPLNPFLQ